MGTIPLSSMMQYLCLGCGAMELSKLIAATHCSFGTTKKHHLGKLHVSRDIAGGGQKNSTKKSYQNTRLRVLARTNVSVLETATKPLTYRFMTATDDQVKVVVEKKNDKYGLYVEVSSLQLHNAEEQLVMSWGIFRSDSSHFMPLDFQRSSVDGKSRAIESPLVPKSLGRFAVELDFEGTLAPFYVSFLLKSSINGEIESEIRSHRGTNFVVPVGFGSGYPAPLGLSLSADGSKNFALFSRSAEFVVLCLYEDTMVDQPTIEIDLDPYINRSGDVWHVSIDSSMPFVRYGYRCKGEHVLLDPYAKIIGNITQQGSGLLKKCLGQLSKEPIFDWGGEVRPCLPMEILVVYRLNVMRFTEDKSCKVPDDIAGTFSGLTEKLTHFKELGVNAILLEPIFPFDEQKGLYFPLHFFSLCNLYGPSSDPLSAISSMKEMVKKFHANGIEVFLEVVFTHTAQGGALREIDTSAYYCVEGGEDLVTRSALNCNYPIVQQLILDSLRHWVIEFHIDGFCFINASSLLRGFHGEILSRPPLVEAIAFDPLLSKTKIIADFWDPHDMISKEILFPHWKRWAEINKRFCEDVRNFVRGEGLLSNLATRLCGSGDIFSSGRGPAFSFNYIARNFGLPLVDLVSFSSSEVASEFSWNCGEEGATNKTVVLERRLKQIRNFLMILFVSLGVPVLNMGDECAQSTGGSPAYENRKSFNWNTLGTGFGVQTTKFISFLTSLRMRRGDLFQKRNFFREENIDWHGSDGSAPRWDDPSSKFLAMTLKPEEQDSYVSSHGGNNLFVAFNAADHSERVILPLASAEKAWIRLVDTALPYPGFFSADGVPILDQIAGLVTYEMKSYSCVLFEARSAGA